MGLTNFQGAMPIKKDISVAKNYLNSEELARLNRMVSAFFDLPELKAIERIPMKWPYKCLTTNDMNILAIPCDLNQKIMNK